MTRFNPFPTDQNIHDESDCPFIHDDIDTLYGVTPTAVEDLPTVCTCGHALTYADEVAFVEFVEGQELEGVVFDTNGGPYDGDSRHGCMVDKPDGVALAELQSRMRDNTALNELLKRLRDQGERRE